MYWQESHDNPCSGEHFYAYSGFTDLGNRFPRDDWNEEGWSLVSGSSQIRLGLIEYLDWSPKTLPVVEGDKLKIARTNKNLQNSQATFVRAYADFLYLKNDLRFQLEISEVNEIKVKRGKKRYIWQGAVVGSVVGTNIASMLSSDDCTPGNNTFNLCGLDQLGNAGTGLGIGCGGGHGDHNKNRSLEKGAP